MAAGSDIPSVGTQNTKLNPEYWNTKLLNTKPKVNLQGAGAHIAANFPPGGIFTDPRLG